MPFECALTIRSETRYLSTLRDVVRAAAHAAGGLPAAAVEALCVALVEAVDNAIVHAHGRQQHRPIRIELAVRDGACELTVVDTGPGIGERACREPRALACRGRGLYLIRQMMTSVASRRSRGRHALRMVLAL